MNELLAQLQVHGREISQRVLDDMYRDPFWRDRFGDKGRRHADEDSDFHLQYLRRALEAGDHGVMTRYAQWLREVLVSRGMCTRHLDENYARLGEALAARGWAGTEAALACLDEVRGSLLYPGGVGRALQAAEGGLVQEAGRALRAREPYYRLLRGAGDLEEDLANLLSYAADACAMRDPALLVNHVGWMQRSLEKAGLGDGRLAEALQAFARGIAARPELAEASAYLQAAIAGLQRADARAT